MRQEMKERRKEKKKEEAYFAFKHMRRVKVSRLK